MEKALGLPEIISCIGKYLSRSDILNCIRVQKSWRNELEASLWREFRCLPSIDSYLGAPSDFPRPSLPLMQRNAHNIRRLYLEEMDPQYHLTFFCQLTQVQEIILNTSRTRIHHPQEEQLIWERFADMIQNYGRLLKIAIESASELTLTPSLAFFNSLQNCPKLVVFETTDCKFTTDTVSTYMKANSGNMRRLSTRRDYFTGGFDFASYEDLVFSEMRYIDLREVTGLSMEDQLEWVTRCPKLISLFWEASSMPVESFCKSVPSSCPNLTALHLFFPLSDQEIEQILEAIPRVEKLTLSKTFFGRLSFGALRKHFPTLRDINLQFSPGATSSMIQEIMSSCPNLCSISGEVLDYGDIVKGQWECKNLHVFDVGITILGSDELGLLEWPLSANRAIYERLSELICLEYLSISNSEFLDAGSCSSLLLSLDAGLRLLESLKRITFFSCKFLLLQACQRGEANAVVEWMIEHWKNLECIEGSTEGVVIPEETDAGINELLQKLKENGVRFEEYQEEMDDDYIFEDDEDLDDEFGFTDLDDDGFGEGDDGVGEDEEDAEGDGTVEGDSEEDYSDDYEHGGFGGDDEDLDEDDEYLADLINNLNAQELI
ncbi:hypothetical protein BGZ76_005520 [Entomortierella beljakovae]|nr:hypothetical protein BGZ76_005520 [Entomortierella beljakovae]